MGLMSQQVLNGLHDGLQISKQVAVLFNNDAKAAFDRMIPSI